jgi:hypothetical protein
MHSETDTTRHKKRWSQSEVVMDQNTAVDYFDENAQNTVGAENVANAESTEVEEKQDE